MSTQPASRRHRPARVDALARYFEHHPGRRGPVRRHLVRRGEGETIDLLSSVLPDLTSWSALDVGCGDGAALAGFLRGRPSLLRLEDIVAARAETAARRLAGRADRVVAASADGTATESGERFDLVVALGVLDYYRDWPARLARLADRCRHWLVVDLPRSDRSHHLLRRAWLTLHGLPLVRGRGPQLAMVAGDRGLQVQLHQTSLSHVLVGRRRG